QDLLSAPDPSPRVHSLVTPSPPVSPRQLLLSVTRSRPRRHRLVGLSPPRPRPQRSPAEGEGERREAQAAAVQEVLRPSRPLTSSIDGRERVVLAPRIEPGAGRLVVAVSIPLGLLRGALLARPLL